MNIGKYRFSWPVGLEALVERVADRLPDRVAVRLDHHRAAREGVLGQVGAAHDLLVPGGEVVGLRRKGHQAPQDSRAVRRDYLSTSPTTKKIEPRIAIRSGMSVPGSIAGITQMFEKLRRPHLQPVRLLLPVAHDVVAHHPERVLRRT